MASHFKLKLSTVAILTAIGIPHTQADDVLLKPVTVQERADGLVVGYRAPVPPPSPRPIPR